MSKKEVNNEVNNELLAIRKRAAEVMGDYPEQAAELQKKIEEAKAARLEAKATKETAMNANVFSDADAAMKEAEAQYALNIELLDHLKYAPRMEEEEYDRAVQSCLSLAQQARDTFREATDKHLSKLQEARDEYQKTIDEINLTIRELDAGANILQNKYRKRAITRYKAPSTFIDDPNEWKRHAVNISPAELFCHDENHEHPYATHISHYVAAWQATQPGKAYPVHMF